MSEKITKLVKELQEKNEELQTEINSLSKTNLTLLDDLKKKFEWDKDLLKEWYEEYWHTYSNQSSENEWFIAVPKFIPFSIGWLDHTTKGYNIFKINQYTQWLGEMPDFLRKELNIKEPEKIFVSDGNLVFTEGKEDEVKDRYGDLLSSVSKGTARVKLGKEFDLIAKIIENGSLPFVPRQVEEKDIIPNSTIIKLEGKYIFQQQAWDNFLKYGAIGIYWMTGAGKDIFSCYALSRIKVKKENKVLPNLYISPNLTILEQMKKDYFPKYAPELLKDIEEGKLILSTYQGHEKIKNMEFGLTIYGECHVLPADTFSRLATLKTKYRIGQCLHPKTKITLANGNVIQIRNLIKRLKSGEKIEVLSYNIKKQIIESKPIINFFEKDMKDLFKISIKTKRGVRKITCSGEHKFFINGKYIPASELKSGDEVMLLNQPHSTLNNPAKGNGVGTKISKKIKGHEVLNITKEKIREKNKEKWKDDNYRAVQEQKHLGHKSYLKGKTYDEYFGKEKSKEIRNRIKKNSKESINKHFEAVLRLQKDFEDKGYKFIPLVKVNPDAIVIKDGKVSAVELENKIPNYDKYKITGKFYDDVIWIVKKIRYRRKE